MKRNRLLQISLFTAACACMGLVVAPSARANVYATNIKLNGSITDLTAPAGGSVTISYILNEAASSGVTVKILQGSTVVRALTFTGAEGTKRGANTVSWDGKDQSGQNLAAGTYSVSITAASQGYPVWTKTTDDNATYNLVWEGRGLAVDKNVNSPYYGRIFVANASPNTVSNVPGDIVGILKVNADGSAADEGGFSTGGHDWAGDFYSPWRLEVSDDDYVYVNDWTGSGEIYRWDPALSTDSKLYVLRQDNWVAGGNMSGPAILGTGTNTTIWMADANYPNSIGIYRFNVGENGTCAQDDAGIQVVGVGTSLTLYPYDVALDKAGNIYTVQFRQNIGDISPRVMRFAAYDPSTNGFMPQYEAEWAIGQSDDTMGRASGLAVDPTGTYLAVAFRGITPASGATNGCTQIFYATNGALVTNLDLGITISGYTTHQNTDCDWDAVGNVYYIDNYYGCWRAFSPPGANQASTVAVPKLIVTQPLQITSFGVSGGTATINFSGATTDPAGAFKVLGSETVNGTYAEITTANVTAVTPGVFKATVPVSAPFQFFRIQK